MNQVFQDHWNAGPALRRRPRLSRREIECLDWASQGKSSSAIGTILSVSPRTVDSYLASACGRLHVRTRIEAVAIAVALGLINPGR